MEDALRVYLRYHDLIDTLEYFSKGIPHMGISINGAAPKWMVYKGKCQSTNGVSPFMETPMYPSAPNTLWDCIWSCFIVDNLTMDNLPTSTNIHHFRPGLFTCLGCRALFTRGFRGRGCVKTSKAAKTWAVGWNTDGVSPIITIK